MDLGITKNRLIYETFSKFSGQLSKTITIAETVEVTQRYIKYFFDFRLFRISFIEKDDILHVIFYQGKYWIERSSLFDYEKELIKSNVPFQEVADLNLFKTYIKNKSFKSPMITGWFYNYINIKICVSVLTDDKKKFDFSNIDVLNLFVDSIATKYRNLSLRDELKSKNQNLKQAVLLIEKKNVDIKNVVNQQQQIIEDRTEVLMLKNKRLTELLTITAHDLREPLSRILGLLEISGEFEKDDIKEKILPFITVSAMDLDNILRNVIHNAEKEIDNI